MAKQPRKKPSPKAPEASLQQLPSNAAFAPIASSQPIFGEPAPSPDPKAFVVKHLSDNPLYNALNKKLLQSIPPPREGANPVLKLADVLGEKSLQKIQSAGRIVFHSVGDTGPIAGPENQSLVADKMAEDFKEDDPADAPSFFFHLGDVVYSFGEVKYYYDQFYEPTGSTQLRSSLLLGITMAWSTAAIKAQLWKPFLTIFAPLRSKRDLRRAVYTEPQ